MLHRCTAVDLYIYFVVNVFFCLPSCWFNDIHINVIRHSMYVITVLWMMSCVHTMVYIHYDSVYSGSAEVVIDELPFIPVLSMLMHPQLTANDLIGRCGEWPYYGAGA